jgi:spore coat polysaccharide biosynthesis protein SpsF
MKVVAIIQARMSSTRLPGKVLLDLAGEPMLARVVERTRRAERVDETVVATSTDASDDPIESFCQDRGYSCFRGSLHDVLDRYYQAAKQYQADVIVRITADCPLIDADVVDQVVGEFMERQPSVHYATNCLPERTFPRGLDTEAIRFDALARAWFEDNDPARREHVTPYIYHHPGLFCIHGVTLGDDCSSHRWTVDTPEDLALVRELYVRLDAARTDWRDILSLIEREPELVKINEAIEQKKYPATCAPR